MGISEKVVRRDVGDGERQAPSVSGPLTPVTAKATEFPRRPDSALDISVSPNSHNVVLKEHPIEVKPTKVVIPDPDVIEVTKPYESAVNEVLTKLDAYAQANGAKVEPSSMRSSITGPISWLLTRKGIAEWVRRTFPVDAYDLTRQEADGTTRKVCQVRIAKGLFSGKAQVTVPRYPGGEIEGNAVEVALGLKKTSGKEVAQAGQRTDTSLNADAKPIRASTAAAPGSQSPLEAEIAQHLSAQEERRIALEKIGLEPEASGWEAQEMQRLVGEIESDIKDLVSGRTSKFVISTPSKGTNAALQRSYKIETPEALRQFQDAWVVQKVLLEGAMFLPGFYSAIAGVTAICSLLPPFHNTAVTLCATGLSIGLAVVAAGAAVIAARYPTSRHNRYLEGSLRSQEPGSLGAIVEKLREAGLGCDIRVGAWDRKEIRVDLTVSYKLTEEA